MTPRQEIRIELNRLKSQGCNDESVNKRYHELIGSYLNDFRQPTNMKQVTKKFDAKKGVYY